MESVSQVYIVQAIYKLHQDDVQLVLAPIEDGSAGWSKQVNAAVPLDDPPLPGSQVSVLVEWRRPHADS